RRNTPSGGNLKTATGTAGVGLLTLTLGVDSGMAATRHYRHHAVHRTNVAVAPQAEISHLATDGNNPAKRYPTRHMSDNAVKTSTLYGAGNNPAKAYPTRQASPDAAREPTLMNSGNNPAKRALVATTH